MRVEGSAPGAFFSLWDFLGNEEVDTVDITMVESDDPDNPYGYDLTVDGQTFTWVGSFTLRTYGGDDVITIRDCVMGAVVWAGSGGDTINVLGGSDALVYGGRTPNDFGDDLKDTITVENHVGINVRADEGKDKITIKGLCGGGWFFGGEHGDTIDGQQASGVLNLIGEGGDDFLYGGTGDDIIEGGPGRDFMFGRGGADTFYSRDGISGNDVITGNDPTVQPGDVAFTDIDGEDEVLGVEQEVRGNP